jgi:hypothetical protein
MLAKKLKMKENDRDRPLFPPHHHIFSARSSSDYRPSHHPPSPPFLHPPIGRHTVDVETSSRPWQSCEGRNCNESEIRHISWTIIDHLIRGFIGIVPAGTVRQVWFIWGARVTKR